MSGSGDAAHNEAVKKELGKKLPRVEKILSETDRDELVSYIRNKVEQKNV